MTIVSPFLTFPDIYWWMQVVHADTVIFDAGEHFEKMTFRNRYHISGSNNSILLSVPLINGRNQHVPMADVQIHNSEKWQVQHWRTLTSVYRRTPYFEHFEQELQSLFETEYTRLIDFNRAGIEWVSRQLRMKFELQETTVFQKEYPGATDLRQLRTKEEMTRGSFRKYYQVFEDRIGFQPNLSILDLLFSEGPSAINWIID